MSSEKSNNSIIIKGAKVHNLKNVDISIPRNKFIVITGLSGSGKSSLAFDTLYAEGQRRYVESLSAYARQFLGRINKPEVDYIKGIPPAIAIEQKVNTRNPRSTVGTSTEIYDYLKLLYARIGKTFSPVSGNLVKRHFVSDVVNHVLKYGEGTRFIISAPIFSVEDRPLLKQLEILHQQGFSRIESDNKIIQIEDILFDPDFAKRAKNLNLVIDRLVVTHEDHNQSRMADSIQTAFYEGHGECRLKFYVDEKVVSKHFSNKFETDGIVFEEPSVHTFSFNNPLGACSKCEGFGMVIGIDEDLVIPNKSLSIYQDAVVCWKGEKMSAWKNKLILEAENFDFPVHKPYFELSSEQKSLLWTGNKYFEGIDTFFAMLEAESYKIQFRVMLSRYRGKTICPACKGGRLKKEAFYIKVNDKAIGELVLMPVHKLLAFFRNLKLNKHDSEVAKRILIEITNRLSYLVNVGLSYLNLNRISSTLSGGESQRINLATSLGSSLVGSLYILDEPSIGLHSRDTHLLIKVLKNLQKIGNTVIVVEHDEEIIRAADEIIDIGPLAGRFGGEIIFHGNHSEIEKSEKSLTAKYLNNKEKIEVPKMRRKWNSYIEVKGARENNLKGIDVKFPLHTMTVVTGVSGSGKSSLVKNILYTSLKKRFDGYSERTGLFDHISGDIERIDGIEFVNQNPIGRSSRSNPVTYLKAYDEIRKLFADQKLSKYHGFKASHFSFNIDGGRCEECQGEGSIKVEMQFMADVSLICESCHGKRFKEDVLEVRYKEKNIHDILEMTVSEAIEFFACKEKSLESKIANKLKPLDNVGLGYVKLGQSSSTLSGGESQRIKLASFLVKEKSDSHILFIFDEPTTGLHFHDIKKLLAAFNALIKKGHSILIVEHNMEIIKSCDWVIDLGKEGGEKGGELIFAGTPEDLANCNESYTGKFLKEKL
ncbi:MAG: excinuclease ABC subunit UvrA [Bacteroidota bacterium]|nr:excinuclease ABC subunit UvrA [Bacteroidota bacterium]